MVVVAALLASAMGFQATLPQYTAQVLEQNQVPGNIAVRRIDSSGDYLLTSDQNYLAAIVGGQANLFPTYGHHNNESWRAETVYDIADGGTVIGPYGDANSDGIFVRSERGYRHIRVAMNPASIAGNGFINNGGDILFNASPMVEGQTNLMFAMFLRGETAEYLEYASAQAQGSSVAFLAENGDSCGRLRYNQPLAGGGFRTAAAAWNRDGSLVKLKEKQNWKASWASALFSKDLVFGKALLEDRSSIPILWKNGEPEAFPAEAGVTVGNVFFTPDKRFVGGYSKGGTSATFTIVNGAWHSLPSLTTNFPRGAEFTSVLDVAANGSLLILGKLNGGRAFFYLKPQTS
jgi:hypothetical protein